MRKEIKKGCREIDNDEPNKDQSTNSSESEEEDMDPDINATRAKNIYYQNHIEYAYIRRSNCTIK